MGAYTQANRPMAIQTPLLPPDTLLLVGFKGTEGLSQLFQFELDLIAENHQVESIAFEKLLAHPITVRLESPGAVQRYFNGICNRFIQRGSDRTFTRYGMAVVPQLWMLTKRIQSRIFQHLTVPEILKQVFQGLDVKFELSGTWEPRDSAQYRESDFAFASRLMEEEGIFYFFRHTEDGHPMVVANAAKSHADLPNSSPILYRDRRFVTEGSDIIYDWNKVQEITTGKVTLWDHSFELPHQHLEAKKNVPSTVTVGSAKHRLDLDGHAEREYYDWPAGYAQRFDGVDKGGNPQPKELQKIFTDNERTAKIRMEQEAVEGVTIEGASHCRRLVSGHKFTLNTLPADPDTKLLKAEGEYVLTSISHTAVVSGYRSGDEHGFDYSNKFECIPVDVPFRPLRTTSKPVIPGPQTAVVVGRPGDEVFCDKYGRVKVQFHWDRQGKNDVDSSCWVRVGQVWAGKGWGDFFWPRVGHEVIVAFEEGDPDRPVIVGSVYNADNMPPFPLPKKNQVGGIKSASVRGKAHANFNGILFEDEKGNEHLAIHSERHMVLNSELDKVSQAGRHKRERISSASMYTVGNLPGCGGGGSGGGPDPLWPHPEPVGVGGLNSVVVFGENVQAAMPLNHQIAFGSNLQVCINPAGLAAGVPGFNATSAATGLLGSGLGGNMQLTIGTNAGFVLGRSVDFSLGDKLEFHKCDPVTAVFCGLIGAVNIVFFIAYGVEDNDARRADWTVAFQVAMDILLIKLMLAVITNKEADDLAKKANKSAAGATCPKDDDDTTSPAAMPAAIEGLGTTAALAAIGILPPVLVGSNEDFYHS